MGKAKNPLPEKELKKSPQKNQVLTKKELAQEPEKSGSPKKKIPEGQKTVAEIKALKNKETKFECGWAPSGKANISFLHTYEGKEHKYNLTLKDRVFILDEKMSKEEKARYREALRANGFIDITVVKSGVYFDKTKKTYIYTAIHPEHCQKNQVNGSISLLLLDDEDKPMVYKTGPKAGQQIVNQVNIVDGRVKTENVLIYEGLIRAGFYSGAKTEKKE